MCVCLDLHLLHTQCACVGVCVHVRIMACLFICRLTPGRPFLLISAPASLFRSPPSWLVMKTPLSKRQVLCLEASKALRCDIAGGHRQDVSSVSNYAPELCSKPSISIHILQCSTRIRCTSPNTGSAVQKGMLFCIRDDSSSSFSLYF